MKETVEQRLKALETQMATVVDLFGTLLGQEPEVSDQFAVAFKKFRARANGDRDVLRQI